MSPPQRRFTVLDPEAFSKTLARRLIPVADNVNDLAVRLGARPYTVSWVRTRWTGGKRSKGEEIVVSETPILPTPEVADLTSLQAIVQPVGKDEVGDLYVSKVSGRYTEKQLRGLGPNGEPIPPDEAFYYELVFLADGPGAERRRFVMRSVPTYKATDAQWTFQLRRAHGDRQRNGDVR